MSARKKAALPDCHAPRVLLGSTRGSQRSQSFIRGANSLDKTFLKRIAESKDAGFTLLELLVVIVILSLLVAFVAPQAIKTLGFAKDKIAKQEIIEFGSYLERFDLDLGRYPNTEEGIAALIEKPADVENWSGPYIKGSVAQNDPWNHPWIYRSPSTRPGQRDYDLCSAGPNGRGTEPGEADTICNP